LSSVVDLVAAPAIPAARRQPALGRGRTWILASCDVSALSVSLALTVAVGGAVHSSTVTAPVAFLVAACAVSGALWLTLFAAYHLYDQENRRVTTASFDEVRDIFHALLAGSLLFLFVAQVLKAASGWSFVSAVEAAVFVPSALVLVPLARGAARSWVFPRVMRPRRVLIVGGGP
jgi:hypothetical protein